MERRQQRTTKTRRAQSDLTQPLPIHRAVLGKADATTVSIASSFVSFVSLWLLSFFCLRKIRIDLLGVHAQVFDRPGDERRIVHSPLVQPVERGDRNRFGIYLEVPPQ